MPDLPEDPDFDDPTVTAGGGGSASSSEPASKPIGREKPFRERFPIADTIGKGGMGEVYLANDRTLRREVAVKLLRSGADSIAYDRFLRESQVTAQLDHPNVVPVHALEVTERGDPALVMKRVRGVDFKGYLADCRKAIREPGEVAEEYKLRVRVEHFVKVCDALAFAHDRGVVHRDVKPANLMLGPFGEVYVMDWGIARIMGMADIRRDVEVSPTLKVSDTTGLVTTDADFVGTPVYMAPEQSRADGPVTGPAADQFALGMLLQEMLTLRTPRDGQTSTALIDAALEGQREECVAIEHAEPVPAALAAAVGRACSFDPEDRYPSVMEFAHDLKRWLRNEELEAYPDNLVRGAWRRLQKRPVRAMTGILVIVVVAAALTTFSLFHVVQTQRESAERTEILTGLVERVAGHLLTKERTAGGIREEVTAIAVAVEAELRRSRGTPGFRFHRPEELQPTAERAPSDATTIARYGQITSFRQPVAVLAPDADLEIADSEEHRLASLPRMFTDSFLRAIGQVPGDLLADIEYSLLAEESGLQYGFVGFESGMIVNYPGVVNWPSDYDPRRRPWYRLGAEADGTVFGEPHLDSSGSGYLLPCVRSIHHPDGSLAGVVGISVRLDLALGNLAPHNLDYRFEASLVDGDAGILFREGEAVTTTPMETLDNRTKQVTSLGVPALEARIRAGESNGVHRERGRLYVFARFDALGWYIVLDFSEAEVLGKIGQSES